MSPRKKEKAWTVMGAGNHFAWNPVLTGDRHETLTREKDCRECPACGVRAVTPLPPSLRAKPENTADGTELVCLPVLGGCNQGYARVLDAFETFLKVSA